MNPALHVHLLGNFQLYYEGDAVNTVKTARLQSLFAFLILHRQAPISRQQLAACFWPDTSDAQSRTNLRNLLHQLRQAFPFIDNFIHSDAYSLEWLNDSPYTLDTEAFERCLAIPPGQVVRRETLEKAVEIYSGDLLPGCYDDWIFPIRERLHLAFLSALEALALMTEEAREYQTALSYAYRLVQIDPLHPGANRQLIRLHALHGDRPPAIKAYHTYARLLKQELGVEPDPEIQDMYNRLRQSSEIIQKSASNGANPLVGRTVEWRRLQSIWQTASRGDAQVVFITGEAGIGKTRLVEELVFWADRQGIAATTAFCYPAEGSLPYAPVVSWLRARPLPALDKIWLSEIARLLPDILKKNPGLPRAEPYRETWQRQHLFEALARALLLKPLAQLLVLEDIQWCDQDTLEWLHYLLRYDPKAPLLLVATERCSEISPDHPLLSLKTALGAEGRYTELELTPLNEAETYQLAGQAARETSEVNLSAEMAAQIYHEAEGIPLFIVEMVRLGKTSPDEDLVVRDSLADSERVQAVLTRRISKLSPNSCELTSLAASIGREFSLDVLRRASGESDKNIVTAIDEMLRLRFIQEISPDTYDFTHDRLRQAVFYGLSTAHRRLLHRKVAEALLCQDEGSPCPRDAEIASHYEHAGMFLQAIQHYRLAAESAAQLFSIAEAQSHLQHAIELAGTKEMSGEDEISPGDLAWMLERMGDLLALDGKYPHAQSFFERALAQSFSPSELWRSQIYRKLCDALTSQYQHALAHKALDQAEQTLQHLVEGGTLAERQEWLQIQLDRIQLFYWGNRPDQMEELIQKISPTVDAVGRIDQQITLLSLQCQVRQRRERYRVSEETVRIGQHRLELAEKFNDPYALAVAQFQYGFSLLWHGDLAAAREWLSKGYAATERIGARLWQLRSLAYLSIASRKLNDLVSLRAQILQLLELAPAMREYTYHGIGLANLGWLAWRDGNLMKAENSCKEANEVWSNFGGDVFHGLSYWVLLAVALAHRDLRQAESYAQNLLDPNPLYQPVEEPIANLLSQALGACQGQDADAAFTLFNQALEKARFAGDL